ncbi:MAG: hypothetical protein E5Y10_19165 [Mesorhizobium sp.]|nr:MAG: hypothetical protein E5Y13_23255 [Mesorhizobium sp.]TJU83221.1 MAG: hypothetical protein E5Y15_14620 [Mesorhizobium sp.]TJU87812.1 MAG: hypothetical protein E5Y10_19165 [Mesorhizobium sp.]
MDPHPNPPHKGEGTPRGGHTNVTAECHAKFLQNLTHTTNYQRQRKSPSPLSGGLGVGVHRRAKASAFQLR